jgi:hypothetical protein
VKRTIDSLKYSQAAQTLLSAALNPQRLRLFVALAICLVALCVPAVAQFSGGTTQVDPTAGAQTLMKYLVDGALYIVASAAVICFFFGVFRLFVRPLEGIMEICVGLIVFGIIGHALGWDSGLTGVQVG